MISYTDSLQVAFVIFAGLLVGLIAGVLKLGSSYDYYHLRRMIFHIMMAGTMFYSIGNSELNKTTWMTLAHALIVQCFMHIIALFYSAIYSKGKQFMVRFIEVSIAICESDYFAFGYPVVINLFSSNLLPHVVITLFVQYLIVYPFHFILCFYFVPDFEYLYANRKAPVDPAPKKEEAQEENKDDGNKLSSVDEESSTDGDATETIVLKEVDGKMVETKEEKVEDNVDEKETKGDVENQKADEQEDVSEAVNSKKLRIRWICSKIFSALNVCAVLGIIWSCIPVTMTTFLDNLEKPIVACLYYSFGIFLWHHSFKGPDVADLLVGIIAHYFVQPFLAIGVAKALSMDKEITRMLAMTYTAPTSQWGHQLSLNAGFGESMISYTMYWTYNLCVPILMIWTAIVNNLKFIN